MFGKYAFLITAGPFLIYLIGTSFGGYLERARKLAPAHETHGIVRSMVDKFDEDILGSLPEELRAEWREKLDIARLREVINDEGAEVKQVERAAKKMLEGDFSKSNLPLDKLKEVLQHHIELQTKVEENDLSGILELHEEFLGKTVEDATYSSERFEWFPAHRSWYPTTYTIACVSALIAVIAAFPGYLTVPFRISWLAVNVGVLGIIVWIGLWYLDKEFLGLGAMLSFGESRAAFRPFVELKDHPTWMWQFIALRFIGLVLVVPIAEEFFLRGFLMRYIDDIDWDEIPLGEATWKAILGVLVYGALTHSGEALAAVVWFGLVTWLYLHTKNIWDCVVVHGVTNLLLGIYVLATGTWELW